MTGCGIGSSFRFLLAHTVLGFYDKGRKPRLTTEISGSSTLASQHRAGGVVTLLPPCMTAKWFPLKFLKETKGGFYNVRIFDSTHPAPRPLVPVPSMVLHPSPRAVGLRQPSSAAPASRQLESPKDGIKPLLQTSTLEKEDPAPS